ncbi:MAG: hypothetical protein US35_C0039G0007, partial [Parcubacteria group bacterium GW2011_GWA2_37_10]
FEIRPAGASEFGGWAVGTEMR